MSYSNTGLVCNGVPEWSGRATAGKRMASLLKRSEDNFVRVSDENERPFECFVFGTLAGHSLVVEK